MAKNVVTVKLLSRSQPAGTRSTDVPTAYTIDLFYTDIFLCFFTAGGVEFFNVSFWAKLIY